MKKTVELTPVEAGLVRLAAQTRDDGLQRLNEAFNNVVTPVIQAHKVPVSSVNLDINPETKIVTMSWEEPDSEPASPKLVKKR